MFVNLHFTYILKFILIALKLKTSKLLVLLHKKPTFVQYVLGKNKFERNLILIVRISYTTD